jgi:hypothetical protein
MVKTRRSNLFCQQDGKMLQKSQEERASQEDVVSMVTELGSEGTTKLFRDFLRKDESIEAQRARVSLSSNA